MTQARPFDPVEFKRKTRQEWHDAATGWRKWHHVVEGEAGGQRHSATLVELARVRPGYSVLDVGGGYGEPSLAAARVVGPKGRVVCTDISAAMLAFARERAREAGLDNIEFVESDAEELDFEDESFDAVVSRATIMFLPDVPGTLARLRSFLKPGGRFAASVWSEPGRLAALVREAGFRGVETGAVSVVFEADTPEEYTEFIRDVAPLVTALLEDQPPDARERIWEKVTEAYGQFVDPDGRGHTTNEAIWAAGTRQGPWPRSNRETEPYSAKTGSRKRRNRMSVEENKAAFRRYVEEVWIEEDLDLVDEVFARKYLSHQSDGSTLERGPEDVKKFVREWRSAFSEVEDVVEDMIGEGDRVATRWRIEATHTGEFRGIPATDKRIRVTGIGVFRFENGKVVESWDSLDQLGMMRQLGAIPG